MYVRLKNKYMRISWGKAHCAIKKINGAFFMREINNNYMCDYEIKIKTFKNNRRKRNVCDWKILYMRDWKIKGAYFIREIDKKYMCDYKI